MNREFQEFEVDGNTFKQMKPMNARIQLHVDRRLGPMMLDSIRTLVVWRMSPSPDDNPIDVLAPLVRELAKMPEADCDYVLDECLSLMNIKRGNAWQPVWDRGSRSLMHEDISVGAMLQIVMKCLEDNLANFTKSLSFGSFIGLGALLNTTPSGFQTTKIS